MKKLKNSLIVLAGFTAIVGLIALVTPMSGRGQANGVPPERDVNVVNPATSPVLVRDVDSDREPFQKTQAILIFDGIQNIQEIAFAVPEGKRFVIEVVHRFAEPGEAVLICSKGPLTGVSPMQVRNAKSSPLKVPASRMFFSVVTDKI